MIAKVINNLLCIEKCSRLVQGTVGQTLSLELPEEWSAYSVTAVFSSGPLTRDVIVTGSEITIPWELLTEADRKLYLNFHAALPDGSIVYQTNITDFGTILPSRLPSGNEPESPSPSRADQIQALAEQALAVAQSVRDDADTGAFDGPAGKGIASIVKTATSGLVDTYTVTYTDSSTMSFTVTNGADGEITASSLADSFSASARYSVGDHVFYNGRLYRFISDHPAGIWIGSDTIPLALANDVSTLKNAVDVFCEKIYKYVDMPVDTTAAGWRLRESNGLCSSDSAYKLVKYKVTAGSLVKVVSDDRFQFQTIASVPSSGAGNRVGKTYGVGTYVLEVPAGATYLIVSTPTGSTANASLAIPFIPAVVDAMSGAQVDFTIGTASSSNKFHYSFFKGVTYRITNNTSAGQTLWLYNKAASNDKQLSTNMRPGATITFTPDSDDYYAFGGWYNGVGTDSLSIDGFSALNSGVKSNKVMPIVFNSGRVSIDAANRTISFASGMYLFGSDGRVALDASDVYSQVSSYASYDAGTQTVTITLPYEDVLAYNFGTNALKVCHYREILPDDVILFAEYYQNDFGILWDKYWRDAFIDSSKKGIVSAGEVFNGEPYSGIFDWQTPAVAYGALFKGTGNVESFAFFTDPHVAGFADSQRNETNMANYCKRVQKVINASPCSFAVCGGDWLNNSTTMDEACYRLGYIKGIAKHLLGGCYLVNGNHDTNYQGKLDSSSENYTGRLADAAIAAIMHRDTDTKKAYYSFDGAVAKCYVLDTGIEHSTMLSYDWEQVAWLAGKLSEDDPAHAIIFLHIITDNGSVQTNTGNFAALVQAYNAHTTVTLNSVTYDFTSCSGHVDFWVGGHAHTDSSGTLGGIPYFITGTNSYNSDVPLVDLVLVDYDAGKIRLIRAGGTGSNRCISL